MGSLGGLSPGGSIALGIFVGVISTSVQSLGLTLQRKSHILEDEKAPHLARRPPYHRRRWQIGMGMFIIANLLGSTIQISTLPLPVLSTLQASGLVFNSICATLILGEPFTRWSLWGTMLVCSGAILIAIFGAIPEPAHNLDELLELLGRAPFVAWMSLQAVMVIAIAVAIEMASLFLAGFAQSPHFRLARGLAYGCISGVLSAHSLLVAKSAVELVVRTIADGNNQFRHWQAWALVLALVTLALTQLCYLHRGLKLVSTSVLYPLVFCIYNIIAILDGLIYFRQTDLIGPTRGCLISLGTVILLSGVLALSWRLSDEQHQPAVGQSTLAPGLGLVDDTEGEEEEEALLLGCSDITLTDGSDEERDTAIIGEELATESHGLLSKKYVSSYHTFTFDTLENGDTVLTATSAADETATGRPPAPATEPPSSPALSRRRSMASNVFNIGILPASPSVRWAERAEIWDELEDQDETGGAARTSPVLHSVTRRPRSSTLPIQSLSDGASAALPHSPLSPFRAAGRRGVSNGSVLMGGPPDGADDEELAAYRKSFRRRRKTTGFPGFHARKTNRQASGSLASGSGGSHGSGASNNTLGNLWNRGWWNNSSNDAGKGKQQVTVSGDTEPLLPGRTVQSEPATPSNSDATNGQTRQESSSRDSPV